MVTITSKVEQSSFLTGLSGAAILGHESIVTRENTNKRSVGAILENCGGGGDILLFSLGIKIVLVNSLISYLPNSCGNTGLITSQVAG